jgi:putative redox protein
MPAMAAAPPPSVALELDWQGELRFAGRADGVALTLDGAKAAGPSPVQALAFALAGCMAIDVVHVLTKGRAPLTGLRCRLTGERRDRDPKHFVAIDLHFTVTGAVTPARVERALALSRETYCSVWHSLRPDIRLTTSFEIHPPAEETPG